MTKGSEITYTLDLANFDISLLPQEARERGTAEFRQAVSGHIEKLFRQLGGTTRILVDDKQAEVSWRSEGDANLLSYALDKLNNSDIADAILLLSLAHSKEPDNLNILHNLGNALSQAGFVDLAIKHLQRALEIAPDHNDSKIALGVCYIKKKEPNKALHYLQKAIEFEQENASILINIGECHLLLDDYEKALTYFLKAIQYEPKNQQCWFGLGKAYEGLKKFEEADNGYKMVINIGELGDLAQQARIRRTELAETDVPPPYFT